MALNRNLSDPAEDSAGGDEDFDACSAEAAVRRENVGFATGLVAWRRWKGKTGLNRPLDNDESCPKELKYWISEMERRKSTMCTEWLNILYRYSFWEADRKRRRSESHEQSLPEMARLLKWCLDLPEKGSLPDTVNKAAGLLRVDANGKPLMRLAKECLEILGP